MEDTIIEKYIKALVSLKEDEFTKNILKPLFEAMGYERVDFNGGPYERGRDLIAQRRIPPRTEMYTVYVQSKKIGDIQNCSEAAKLTQLIHQLRQCCTTGVIDFEGRKIYPNEVFLACPEKISSRLKEEIDSQLFNEKIKVIPLDGPLIISYIKEFKPDILSLLTNIEDKLRVNNFEPGNKELLNALKSTNKTKIDNFYSDLSFFVGSFDSNLLLHLKTTFKESNLIIPIEKWTTFKEATIEILNTHDIKLITESFSELDANFNKHKSSFESEENNANILKKKNIVDQINDLTNKAELEIKALEAMLKREANPLNRKISHEEESDRDGILASLKASLANKTKIEIKTKNSKTSFHSGVYNIATVLNKRVSLEQETVSINKKIIQPPFYQATIDTTAFTEKVNQYKFNYLEGVRLINAKKMTAAKLKLFLTETQKTLSLMSKLKEPEFLLSSLIDFQYEEDTQDRVSISPHDVFSTRHDIAVYGGAGVGKTTTLEVYSNITAKHKPNNLIYIPLNRIADEFKKIINTSQGQKIFDKDLVIKLILLSKGLSISNEHVEDTKRILSGDLTSILDGLDEIYNTIPKIIPAISEFKKKNPTSQLIISSRDCVSYLKEIEFLGITLLPFTREQLNKFIGGWFSDKNKAMSLLEAIEARNLYEHVKTPLLATILCSLVEKGVNAPSSENEIYSERLRLLTGEYDLYKNIARQKQKADLLKKCAVKLAFYMHKTGVRNLAKKDIINALVPTLSEHYNQDLLENCVEELISPCNILALDPITKTYSFGHFRFQEHLVSEELKYNRNIDLSELVIYDWWRGVLCLYAQENEISAIIEDTYKRYGHFKNAKITLEAMIENTSQKHQKNLKNLLSGYLKSDRMDSMFTEYSDEIRAWDYCIDRYSDDVDNDLTNLYFNF